MREWVKVVLGVLALTVGASAPTLILESVFFRSIYQTEHPRDRNIKGSDHEPNRPYSQNQASAPAVPGAKVASTQVTQSQATTSTNQSKENNSTAEPGWVPYAQGLSAVAGLLVAAVIAGINFAQWSVYRRQARIMMRELAITRTSAYAAQKSADALPAIERAYIFLSEERVPAQIARPNGSVLYVPEEEIKYPMTAVTRFRNHGRTPAVVTRIAQSIAYFQAQPLEFPDKMATIPAGIVIGTGKVSRRWCSSTIVSRIEWDDAKDGVGYILLIGRIFYKTVFGGTGETGFCFEYDWETNSFVMSTNDKLNYYR